MCSNSCSTYPGMCNTGRGDGTSESRINTHVTVCIWYIYLLFKAKISSFHSTVVMKNSNYYVHFFTQGEVFISKYAQKSTWLQITLARDMMYNCSGGSRISWEGRGAKPWGAKNIIFGKIFVENSMKIKKLGREREGASPQRPPWIRQWIVSSYVFVISTFC